MEKLERLDENKFSQLNPSEMKNVEGGRTLVSSTSCTGPGGGQVSRSVYSYNWFERNVLGHEATEEENDKASSCDDPVIYIKK